MVSQSKVLNSIALIDAKEFKGLFRTLLEHMVQRQLSRGHFEKLLLARRAQLNDFRRIILTTLWPHPHRKRNLCVCSANLKITRKTISKEKNLTSKYGSLFLPD